MFVLPGSARAPAATPKPKRLLFTSQFSQHFVLEESYISVKRNEPQLVPKLDSSTTTCPEGLNIFMKLKQMWTFLQVLDLTAAVLAVANVKLLFTWRTLTWLLGSVGVRLHSERFLSCSHSHTPTSSYTQRPHITSSQSEYSPAPQRRSPAPFHTAKTGNLTHESTQQRKQTGSGDCGNETSQRWW